MIELQVLNYILDSKDSSFILVNGITDEYFNTYKEEFNWVKDHYDRYGNIPDKASFLSKFTNFDVIEVKESSSYLLSSLYDEYNKHHLANVFNKVRKLLLEDRTSEAVKLFNSATEEVKSSTALSCVDIFKDTSRYESYVERCNDFSKFYVTTGFKELDDIFGGWDRQEELATFVARPNQGKSWVLLKCAIAAAEKGLNVGLYSGEMSENKVGYRADTLISHISNTSIIHGKVDIQNDYKKFIDSLNSGLIKGSIKVLTPQMINGSAGVTSLRAFIEKENLDMLCVDQHSLLEDDRHGRSDTERAANVSMDLKRLQTLKRIPIISVSQQNREDTSESGANTKHIARTDRIGQDSTIVIFFEQKDGVMRFTIGKSRDSEVGKKLEYAIDLDKGIFKFMPATNDATDGADCDSLKEEFDEEEPF